MLVLLLFTALSRSYGASFPIIPNVVDVREVLQSGPPALQEHKPRTRFDIIWTCVSTLFICTWVAIHPNVPPRGEGHIRSLWRRIKLMLWTLVVPELILIWAYRQWAAARYIAELFEDEHWTPVHGHFLIMGGFSLVKDGVETVLDFESFFELLKIETAYTSYRRAWGTYRPRFQEPFEIAFPTITAAEIHDKARGDFLSKAIVILQSLWFIVQCIARGKQGLALTELELVTLALASLNGVMYYFWWDKPLGVKEPIKVYPSNVDPPKKVIYGEGRLERIRASSGLSIFQKFIICPFHRFWSSVYGLLHHMHTTLTWYRAQLSSIHHQLSSISLSTINQFLHDQRQRLDRDIPGSTHLWFLYLPIMWFFYDPLIALVESLSDIATTTTLKPDATHVPTFYAPNTDSLADHESLVLFGLPVVAAIFGALHCIAWNFYFPSHIEQLLWRIGSLTITLIPSVPFIFYTLALFVFLVVFSIDFLLKFLEGRYGFHLSIPSISLPRSVKNVLEAVVTTLAVIIATLWVIIMFLAGAGLVAYMLARLLLLTQAIMLLRKQPESVFYAINWTNFLPHI